MISLSSEMMENVKMSVYLNISNHFRKRTSIKSTASSASGGGTSNSSGGNSEKSSGSNRKSQCAHQ